MFVFVFFPPKLLLKFTDMGILGLSKLIADVAPQAIKESDIKNYFGELKWKLSLHILIFVHFYRTKGGHRCIDVFVPIPNRCTKRRCSIDQC